MFDDINMSLATSARQVAEISRRMDEKNQREAEHRAKLEAGAEADIAQKELLQSQLETLREQNGLLSENYEKLKAMYDSQVEANEAARNDLKSSRKFNAWMMVIAIIAMLAAIAGPIATLLSKGKIFPLGKQHQRIRLKFHVLKLDTWAAGEAFVLQEVRVTSWK